MKGNNPIMRHMLLSVPFAICCIFGSAVTAAEKSEYIYLFSSDARFLKIDASNLRIVDVGNLWWRNIFEVDGIIEDPLRDVILLKTKVWKLVGIENPTRAQFDMAGLVVLREVYVKGRNTLALQRAIQGPSGASLSSGKFLDLDRRELFLTWTREEESKQVISVVKYDQEFKALETINGFPVYPRSCLSSDKKNIYTPRIGIPREIEILNQESMKIESFSYDHVGGQDYFSKVAVVERLHPASKGCLMLVKVSQERGGRISTIFLYDMEQRQILSEFRLDITGDFHILRNGKFILVDQVEYTPLDETSLRRDKVGRLLILESSTGKQIASLTVPPNGNLAALLDEERGYYISPGRVTVLNLNTWTVRGGLDVPFEQAYLSLYRGN